MVPPAEMAGFSFIIFTELDWELKKTWNIEEYLIFTQFVLRWNLSRLQILA